MFISTSGIIEVPQDLMTKVKDQAHLIFLSYAYHATRLDALVAAHHITVLKMLKYYGIETPLEKYQLAKTFFINYDDSDLPPTYFKYYKGNNKRVIINIEETDTSCYGSFIQPSSVQLHVRLLYNVLRNSQFDYNMLFEQFKVIDGTIEHELTHFVQHTYLHEDNVKSLPGYYTKPKDYYNSEVEFSPTLKSDAYWLAQYAYKIPPKDYNEAIRHWIWQGTYSDWDDEKRRSRFFKEIRDDAEKYKKACWLFHDIAIDTIKQFVQDHKQIAEVEADRKDYVFGKLRLNEFSDLVKTINTFITYPESRLQDYQSLTKYYDRIDNRFKQDDGSVYKLFVPCNSKFIDFIKAGKKFAIDLVFSDPVVKGTGMMFEFQDLPMILNIDILTHDAQYNDLADEYELTHLKGNFVVADGSKFKFGKNNLIGIYNKGVKVPQL